MLLRDQCRQVRPSWTGVQTQRRSSPAAQSTKRHHPPCPSECQCGCDPRAPRAFCAPILSARMGATLVPWSCGRCLLWDATCPDTLAPSYIQRSAVEASSAAALAESKKLSKYATLSIAHEFVPVAIETLGSWGSLGLAFVSEVGRRISAVSGDPRSTLIPQAAVSDGGATGKCGGCSWNILVRLTRGHR